MVHRGQEAGLFAEEMAKTQNGEFMQQVQSPRMNGQAFPLTMHPDSPVQEPSSHPPIPAGGLRPNRLLSIPWKQRPYSRLDPVTGQGRVMTELGSRTLWTHPQWRPWHDWHPVQSSSSFKAQPRDAHFPARAQRLEGGS